MTEYAYIRVSSRTQNEARQIAELNKRYPSIDPDNIVIEKASGKNFIGRTAYMSLRSRLKAGDLLIVISLDRLGRNMEEVSREWQYLTNNNIDIDVLDMPLLNTRKNQVGITGQLITKLVVDILAYVGEKERQAIKERQRQGIAEAMRNNVKFGRPTLDKLPSNFVKYYKKGYKPVEIRKICDISKTTYYRYAKRMEALNEPIQQQQ